MGRTRHVAITVMAALTVAGGGVAIGQATQDEATVVAPAEQHLPAPFAARPAPRLPSECNQQAAPDVIVYCGESNYGEASIMIP